MSGRPEGEASDYSYGSYDSGYDWDAWQEFTPWRPGDAPVADSPPARGAIDTEPECGRWWTEDVPRRLEAGDRVRAQGAVGGLFISHVPDNTRGRVTSTRHGVLGDEYATVEFENGYTEEVRTSDLRRDSWW